MHYYELWDRQTRNLISDFADEDELRAALREMADIDSMALAKRDDRGRTEWISINSFLEAGALAI